MLREYSSSSEMRRTSLKRIPHQMRMVVMPMAMKSPMRAV